MSEPAYRIERHFTYDDYRGWDDDQRWELIHGEAFLMTPAPTTRHQRIVSELAFQLNSFFRGKRCQVFESPTDVVLSDEDVVQPDVLVVCDPARIKSTHIQGAPTLVVEVLSPSSETRDRRLKLPLYAGAGVQEFWIVTPWPHLVEVFVLDGASYRVAAVYEKKGELVSPTFPDLKVQLPDVFNFPLEPGEEPPVVREPPGKYVTREAKA